MISLIVYWFLAQNIVSSAYRGKQTGNYGYLWYIGRFIGYIFSNLYSCMWKHTKNLPSLKQWSVSWRKLLIFIFNSWSISIQNHISLYSCCPVTFYWKPVVACWLIGFICKYVWNICKKVSMCVFIFVCVCVCVYVYIYIYI